jgi:hypothetical protein
MKIVTTITLDLAARYLLEIISQWEITVIVAVIVVTGGLFLSVI